MEQLTFLKSEDPKRKVSACAFTGHRDLDADFSEKALREETEKLILRGVTDFYNGMAMGFDLIAAETVLKLKKKYPKIRLIACIPCYNQERGFTDKDKKRYVKILKKADEKVQLADEYYRGCMQVRDKYMAERADVMIAYCKKETGGAAYTVRCFKRVHKNGEIIFL